MNNDNDTNHNVKRRDFLSSAAIPVAAALLPPALFAQASRQSTSTPETLRLGIVGAGGIVSSVHIPGFRKIPGVEIVAVANRSMESSQRAATELGIARAYPGWEELLEDDALDAVLIGTWPTCIAPSRSQRSSAACTCCVRRAWRTTAKAREMLAASQRHSNLVCQLVPTSGSYRIDRALQRLLREGYVGDVLSVEVQMLQRGFADFDGELDWRHDREFSGYNVLNVGGTYESVMRWLGPGNRVMGMTRIHIPRRRDEQGALRDATIPDHVEVLYELANGAPVHMKFSETTGLSSGNQIWIFGSEGTIRIDGEQKIFVGRRGDSQLTELPNPREEQAFHRVEEEFVNAIRGTEKVSMNTFEIGVRYMEFTEAAYRSSESGRAIDLPLTL